MKYRYLKLHYHDILMYFIIIDSLFLSTSKFNSIPYSLLFIIIYYFINIYKEIGKKTKIEYLELIIIALLILVSTVMSFLNFDFKIIDNIDVNRLNINRSAQIIFSLLYYVFAKECFDDNLINLKDILMVFIKIYILLGLLYFLNFEIFSKIIRLWNYNILTDYNFNRDNLILRYKYIWGDPNNSEYVFLMIIFFLMEHYDLNKKDYAMLLIFIIISLILSMSTGAIIAVILTVVLKLCKGIVKGKSLNLNKKKIFSRIGIVFFGAILIVLFIYYFNELIELAILRMFNNSESGEVRIMKYISIFSKKLPEMIGNGYLIILDGKLFAPHSDHIRFLYAYGIIAYIMILLFFFRDIFKDQYSFLIPAFMAFSANSLIEEIKIFIIFLLLLGISRSKEENNNREKVQGFYS